MSSKRQLYPCAKSDDFELLQVTSGSETESATEDSPTIASVEKRPRKKIKFDEKQSGSNSDVEVICVEPDPMH